MADQAPRQNEAAPPATQAQVRAAAIAYLEHVGSINGVCSCGHETGDNPVDRAPHVASMMLAAAADITSQASATASSPTQAKAGHQDIEAEALRRAAHYFRDMAQEHLPRRRVIEILDHLANEADPPALDGVPHA